jgi:acyl carrier protein
MDETLIYARLTEILRAVFDDEAIVASPNLSARDVDGWDSLAHIRLIATVEKAFKIRLSASQVGKLANVGDLVDVIKSRV